MKFPFEELIPYRIAAIIVLAVFYGIYFAKMLVQRPRDRNTPDRAARKEINVPWGSFMIITETKRLFLREMVPEDHAALYAVLADSDIMRHYPYTFDGGVSITG